MWTQHGSPIPSPPMTTGTCSSMGSSTTLTRFSLRAVQTIAMVLARAGEAGKKVRLALAKRGVMLYAFDKELQPVYRDRPKATQRPTRDNRAG